MMSKRNGRQLIKENELQLKQNIAQLNEMNIELVTLIIKWEEEYKIEFLINENLLHELSIENNHFKQYLLKYNLGYLLKNQFKAPVNHHRNHQQQK